LPVFRKSNSFSWLEPQRGINCAGQGGFVAAATISVSGPSVSELGFPSSFTFSRYDSFKSNTGSVASTSDLLNNLSATFINVNGGVAWTAQAPKAASGFSGLGRLEVTIFLPTSGGFPTVDGTYSMYFDADNGVPTIAVIKGPLIAIDPPPNCSMSEDA